MNFPVRIRRTCIIALLLCFAAQVGAQQRVEVPPAPAEFLGTGSGRSADAESAYVPDVYSFSGSPLLLQISIADPDSRLARVDIESAGSQFRYTVPALPARTSIELTVSPFLDAGVYDLDLSFYRRLPARWLRPYIREPEQIEPAGSAVVRVGFVNWIWGRDNLRFGNNWKFESVIGTFGEVLAEWLEERFGGVSDAELVLLVDYMYAFFGTNSGLCYAFSGTELRYWRHPELLPSYYDETYDIRGHVSRYQREMNFLQLDVVYDHFVAGGVRGLVTPLSGEVPARREEILREVDDIVRRIDGGEPVAVGFMGPGLHHSMLVYGYIHNAAAQTIDLIVANNWTSEEKVNLRSEDAEAVRVYLAAERDGAMLEWIYSEGKRESEINRLFVVDVREEYHHQPQLLKRLLAEKLARLQREQRALLVVENAKAAWLSNKEEETTGYVQRRTREQLEAVTFDKVDRNYRFEYPAGSDLTLNLSDDDDDGARVLHVAAGPEPGAERAWVQVTSGAEDDNAVERQLVLDPLAPSWVELAAGE